MLITRTWSLVSVGLLGFISNSAALVANVSDRDAAIAKNLELFWSYGRSPPVYPTPQFAGAGDWEDAYIFARSLVSQMTNDEKNNLTYGYVVAGPYSTTVN